MKKIFVAFAVASVLALTGCAVRSGGGADPAVGSSINGYSGGGAVGAGQ